MIQISAIDVNGLKFVKPNLLYFFIWGPSNQENIDC